MPELRPTPIIQPSIERQVLEEPWTIIMAERSITDPGRVTNVAMKAGRIIDVWKTTEHVKDEVFDDKEER